jgi:hypothetical protein
VHPAHASDRPAVIWPPHEVRTVCAMFLEHVDEAAPGLVEGLYLHGSLGFGEWYGGRSDIDYVAVLSRRPDPATTAVLRDVHARVADTFPRPAYDGFHLTWDDLVRPPRVVGDVPCTQGGIFHDAARLDVHPVTWHELAWHGVVVRGPEPSRLPIWTNLDELRAYTHADLGSYWAEQAVALRRFPAEAARADIAAWVVLGVPRLHHLLATDRLTSKNGAGHHVVDVFGDTWRPLVAEALAYRATGERAGLLADEELAAQVVELADLVVQAGLAIGP